MNPIRLTFDNPRPKCESFGLHMNADGWSNIFTGLGDKTKDKRENTQYALTEYLSWNWPLLSDLYRGEGLATKVIDIPAKDMIREWVQIEGDTDNALIKYMDGLKIRTAFKQAVQWSRLYGGSMIFMGIDDGQKPDAGKEWRTVLEKPLREDTIQKVGFFRVYDRWQITWSTMDIDTDMTSENYGKPLVYTITPLTQSPVFQQFRCHYSRLLRFNGKPLPEREAIKQWGWGDSALQPVYDRIKGFVSSLIASEAIVEEFTLGIMEITNLQELVASKDGPAAIANRLNQIDMAKHVLNTILVDKDEKFTRLTAQVNGIKDILEFLKANISAVAGIPEIKLFGEQSKGLGSQASGSIRLYYDDLAQDQQDDLFTPLHRACKLIASSRDFKRVKDIGDDWRMTFNSLWQLTDKEKAEIRNLVSQADDRYAKDGILTPDEIADSRFGGDSYSVDTILDPSNAGKRKMPTPVKQPFGGKGGKDGGTPANSAG